MQIQTFKVGNEYFARGFLISTKPSRPTYSNPVSGFSISKDTGHERVKTFIGKSFAIIPKSLENASAGSDGHFYGNSRDEIVQGYNDNGYGIIKGLYGPFYYNDQSGDYWYDFNIKLANKQAADALEYWGKKMENEFSVSPHIIRQEENPHNSRNWEGLGVALVRQGAFGNDAVISRMCNGTEMECTKSMAGAVMNQPRIKLDKEQLSDLHASIRVSLEETMEADISNQIYRTPRERDILQPSGSGTDYIKKTELDVFEKQLQIKSDPQSFYSKALADAQAPSARTELSPETTMLQDYKDIVNRDLEAQQNVLHAAYEDTRFKMDQIPRGQWNQPEFLELSRQRTAIGEESAQLRGVINERESQVEQEFNSVASEIQSDIDSGSMQLDAEGQLVSERFGNVSASEAMASGDYGQTNGGIRGITDSTVNVTKGGNKNAGGEGECCIMNQYGGGGCGPCNRGSAGAHIHFLHASAGADGKSGVNVTEVEARRYLSNLTSDKKMQQAIMRILHKTGTISK